MAQVREVTVPDIGDFEGVPVIEVHVAAGDSVAAEDPLVTLESDKATMDVPSPLAGVVAEVLLKVGDTASEGTPVARITEGEASEPAAEAAPAAEPGSAATAKAAAEPGRASARSAAPQVTAPGRGDQPVYASPSARRLARELGVDLLRVEGSGRKGRIVNCRRADGRRARSRAHRGRRPGLRPGAVAGGRLRALG